MGLGGIADPEGHIGLSFVSRAHAFVRSLTGASGRQARFFSHRYAGRVELYQSFAHSSGVRTRTQSASEEPVFQDAGVSSNCARRSASRSLIIPRRCDLYVPASR